MGLFGNFFNSKSIDNQDDSASISWLTMNNMAQLDDLAERSKVRPQAIFKHSTTCGISRMVLNMFNSSYSLEPSQMDFYFLDLHAYREVSNAVADRFGILHQSPQLLIIKNGVVVTHSSHGEIPEIKLEQYV